MTEEEKDTEVPWTTLKFAKVWTVQMAPPPSSIKGHLIRKNRSRKIIVEVNSTRFQGEVSGIDSTRVRILEPNKNVLGIAAGNNDAELSSTSTEAMDQYEVSLAEAGWSQKYTFALRNVSILETNGLSCILNTKEKRLSQTRTISFESEAHAIEFSTLIESRKETESRVAIDRYPGIFTRDVMSENKSINLLFEVVSAWDLSNNLLNKSPRPYVVASLNDEEIHRTNHVHDTNNPVWTLSDESLFILETKLDEFFSSQNGIKFEVRDSTIIGGSKSLGCAWFKASDLYSANGSRIERKLFVLKGDEYQEKGSIAIRCRHATQNDLSFLFKYKNKLQIDDFERDHFSTKAKRPIVGAPPILVKNKQVEKQGKVKYRVRPEPDPNKISETEWMTESQIEEISKEDSTTWIDIGSGKLARIFFEILSCDDLPSIEKQIGLQNSNDKPDAFVSIVYEDSAIFSDVIDNCSSPRWPSWSRRAFIFHMMHPSSQINLGVFNHNFTGNHDYIGRISIDITNLDPNLIYNMRYNLKTNTCFEDRKSKGFINLRFRIEYSNDYNALRANLKAPPEILVNVRTKKESTVVRKTCFGVNDTDANKLGNIKSYISELKKYSEAQIYIVEALKHVLLWRNTFTFKIKIPTLSSNIDSSSRKTIPISLPLHSTFLFASSVLAIESPVLIPSIFFAWVAVILKSTSDFRQTNPNPWLRQRTIAQIIQAQLPGKGTQSPIEIESNENQKEIEIYLKHWDQKLKQIEEKAMVQARINEEISKENDDLDEMIGDFLSDETSLRARLSPLIIIHKQLEKICKLLRFVRNVLLWEESYFSFILFIGSVTLSLVFFLIPWAKLLLWIVRMIVWTFLGPWAKLVDIFLVSKSNKGSNEEEINYGENQRKRNLSPRNIRLQQIRINHEKVLKLKAMKRYLFGNHVTKIPVIKQDRFFDKPLPESCSKEYKPKKLSLGEIAIKERGLNITRVEGQQLVGDMIHTRVSNSITNDIRKGQHIKDQSLLSPGSVASEINEESSSAAFARVGGLVGLAAIISVHIVPVMISTISWATNS